MYICSGEIVSELFENSSQFFLWRETVFIIKKVRTYVLSVGIKFKLNLNFFLFATAPNIVHTNFSIVICKNWINVIFGINWVKFNVAKKKSSVVNYNKTDFLLNSVCSFIYSGYRKHKIPSIRFWFVLMFFRWFKI